MRSPSATPTPFSLLGFSLFGIAFALALMTTLARSAGSRSTEPSSNPPSKQVDDERLPSARNPQRLFLFRDSAKVVG